MTARRESIHRLDMADAYLLTSAVNVSYASRFTGDSAELLITKGDVFFFTDSRYTEQAKKDIAPNMEIVVTGAKTRMAEIGRRAVASGAKTLALEHSAVTMAQFEEIKSAMPMEAYPDISPALLNLRAVKTEEELALMRRAAAGNDSVLAELQKRIRIGMTELDVRAELLYQIHRLGMDSAFAPIVAAGANSALPHATVTDYTLANGDFLTLDFGCKYRGYCSDITRTFGLGNVDAQHKNIYDIVKQAQQAALDCAAAGEHSARALDAAAREVIDRAGYGEYFGHGVGHGVGMEIHENPVLNPYTTDTLVQNMVYTIEPGIYIPGQCGVRIEDMCIAGEGNVYRFTKDLVLIQ